MMKVFVCDDEPLAVRRLCTLLQGIVGVEMVGCTTDPTEAVRMIEATAPDLLLLDIEMPEMDGFDVVDAVARLKAPTAPLVAFVTAYRRFAPEAFECGAIDFLSKPVRAARLEATVARSRDALAGREARARLVELERNLSGLRSDRDLNDGNPIWVSKRGEMVRVDLDRIDRVEAEGAYVRLHVDTNSYLHREAIGHLVERLAPDRFVRVHRSHIVRVDRVASIRRTIHGGSELILQDERRIPVGRKYTREARRRLLKSEVPDEANWRHRSRELDP